MEPNVRAVVFDLDPNASGGSAEADRAFAQDRSVLSADEVERASRFKFEYLARRYCRGRAELRCQLGAVVNVAPERLTFRYGAHGKPELIPIQGCVNDVAFNLAHSENVALLVIADFEVGVDLELIRDGFADDVIAERFFAPVEVADLRALPVGQQRRAFFRCWTRKEAYLKALGGGLQIDLNSFTVSFADEAVPPRVTWIDPASDERAEEWAVADLGSQLALLGIDCEASVAAKQPHLAVSVSPR